MLKRTALIALAAAVIGFAAMPHAEAAGYKSKSSSFRPKASAPYTKPSTPTADTRKGYDAARSTKYTNPAAVKTPANTPYRGQSATDGYRKPNTTVNKTTVVQKNYYGGGNGYNRNSGNGYGGGYGGGSGGAGVGTAILGGAAGAVGGMLLMDALTEDEGEKALKLQQEQKLVDEARAQQERDDKQDQILEGQKEIEQDLEQKMIPEPSDDFFKVNPAADGR